MYSPIFSACLFNFITYITSPLLRKKQLGFYSPSSFKITSHKTVGFKRLEILYKVQNINEILINSSTYNIW